MTNASAQSFCIWEPFDFSLTSSMVLSTLCCMHLWALLCCEVLLLLQDELSEDGLSVIHYWLLLDYNWPVSPTSFSNFPWYLLQKYNVKILTSMSNSLWQLFTKQKKSKEKKLPSTFLYIPVQKVDVFPSSGSMVYVRKLASAESSTDTKEEPATPKENKNLLEA